jgi:hypothetical protein
MRELAHALRLEVDRASQVFATWTEADVTKDRGTGKWIRKEILGHLIDSALNNHERFVRAQLVTPFVWSGYEQDEWVTLQRYRDRPWGEIVALWVALNRHVAAVIENVPRDKLQTPCLIGGREASPLEWWMTDYLRHLRHHLEQIEGE